MLSLHQFSSSGLDYGGNNQSHLTPPPPVLHLYSSSANGTQRSSMSSAHTAGAPKQRQYSPLRNPPELFQPVTLREGPHASRQLQPTLLLNSNHHRASAGSINRVSLERERERERSQAEEQRKRSLEDDRRGEERRRSSYDTDGPGDQHRRYETINHTTYDNMTGDQ